MENITTGSGYFEYGRVKPMSMPAQHYHNFYEMYFLEKGSGKYFIDNRVYTISANDLFLIPKGVIHKTSYTSDSDDNLRRLLSFSSDYINPAYLKDVTRLFSMHCYRPSGTVADKIKSVLDDIERECNFPDALSGELIKCRITELFSILIRNKPINDKNISDEYNPRIINIIEYLNQNFQDDITLEKTADAANMHKCYFSRVFKEYTGFGFKEYITLLRLKKAQSLVIGSRKNVSEIAFECGFNDSNYFSLVFSRYFGCSPLKYRHKYASSD